MDSLKEVSENSSFCSLAWNHQFIDPTGRVKPCCRFDDSERPPSHHLSQKSVSEVFEGEWMNQFRQNMLQGQRIKGCIRCYQEEDSGKRSLRQRYNRDDQLPIDRLVHLEHPRIRWLELAISNDCNLACRMCDSRYSYRWYKEELFSRGNAKSEVERASFDLKQIHPFLDDLVHIKFTGGEPLMTAEHWQLIRLLTERRDCSEILLNYSTNCTFLPKPQWVHLWKKFKGIEFALSLDSVNKAENEYIRWPAKHDKIMKVVKAFLDLAVDDQFIVSLRSTVSILNIWTLVDVLKWWKSFHPRPLTCVMNPTHLTYPKILSVTVLPSFLKEEIADHLFSECKRASDLRSYVDTIVSYMFSRDDSELLPRFRQYLQDTDAYRGQDFSRDYPQYSRLFSGIS